MYRLVALSVLFFPSLAQAHGVHPHLNESRFAMGAAFAIAAAAFVVALAVVGRKPARLAADS